MSILPENPVVRIINSFDETYTPVYLKRQGAGLRSGDNLRMMKRGENELGLLIADAAGS